MLPIDWYRKENGGIDRKKVIDELERDLVREPDEQTHIIGTFDREAVEGALELLKATYPEPHCLTLEELRKIDPGTVLWREIYGDEPTVCEFSGTEKFWEVNTDIYGESFRLWTAKPSEEQRKAVKWND